MWMKRGFRFIIGHPTSTNFAFDITPKEVLLKVKEFFLKEKQATAPIIPFEKVNDRVAAATGISLRTVTRIIGEGRLAEASSSKIVTPGKNRKKRKDKILMDDFDIGVLRRKIHEFYTMKREIPTVKEFFLKEKQATAPIIPFEKVNDRVAAATVWLKYLKYYRNKNNCHVRSSYLFSGISLRTVTRIIGEGRLAEASSSKIVTPGKNRKKRKDKILMDDFDIGVLRRKIHEFYTMKREIPTVNKLYCFLKEDIGFKGSREILRHKKDLFPI
ncbi:unnamed protein product [Leptidea sinapis]|uniref:Uncharacterized protein n=1 Tax=Leptidea sinapis TaxID=189913 RepID=A0A5E4R647_9NEOP|nr:unnamed protein product [Leptidea sinapis]